MPALFAYLIAVALLLGGGYSALSWLAAPEPVKVATRAKPKPSPQYQATSQAQASSQVQASSRLQASSAASPSEAGQSAPEENKHAAASSTNQASSPQSDAPAANEQSARPQTLVESAQNQQSRSAHAEASSNEVTERVESSPAQDKQPAEAAPPVLPSNPRAAASTVRAPAVKTARRPHLRQPRSHSARFAEESRLPRMSLRTIEFPDGRRVTQLIPYPYPPYPYLPYRGRALDFEPDDDD